MAGRSSLQPNSPPTMEAVPLQCCPKNVNLNAPHRRFLPRRPPQDWDAHPKNIIVGTATTALAAAVPASIRQRPIIAMPAIYTRTSTTYDREIYKLEKERFEKVDEAETIHRSQMAIIHLLLYRLLESRTSGSRQYGTTRNHTQHPKDGPAGSGKICAYGA